MVDVAWDVWEVLAVAWVAWEVLAAALEVAWEAWEVLAIAAVVWEVLAVTREVPAGAVEALPRLGSLSGKVSPYPGTATPAAMVRSIERSLARRSASVTFSFSMYKSLNCSNILSMYPPKRAG